MSNTVDVILDKWSLKEGQDKIKFMEQMVKSDDIFRVIIICDKNYAKKADERKDGVGTETQIISSKIYNDVTQEKFVILLLDRDENGNEILPTFLNSRKYIDFSNMEYYDNGYESLLRNILEKPTYPKPKVGNHVPSYIDEESVNNSITNSLLRSAKNQISKNPKKINSITNSFLNQFLESLWDFEIKDVKANYPYELGKVLLENLKSFKNTKTDFCNFMRIITDTEFENEIDSDLLIQFFEKVPIYKGPRDKVNSYNSYFYENYLIIFHELFIYVICICLINKNYKLIGDLLHKRYYFAETNRSRNEPKRYSQLYFKSQVLKEFNSNNHRRYITIEGHYLINNLVANIKKEDFILADTILHYIGVLFGNINNYQDKWFPHTYLYSECRGEFIFFNRFSSKSFFNRVKIIFDVNSPEEFLTLIENHKKSVDIYSDRVRYAGDGYESIKFIFEVLPTDGFCRYK